jgi:biotin-dependent carboxylase-like uncharacterized protein
MLTVLEAGILTTIQDAGRWGYQAYGVPVSGAMDVAALGAANQLVHNPPDEAALEIHSSVALQTDAPHLIALTGADARLCINGRALPMWMSIFVRAGTTIEITPARAGGWRYLAIHGGIEVPRVLGSKSTFVRGRLGGLEGRALLAGDAIRIGAPTLRDLSAAAGERIAPCLYGEEMRIVLGPHTEWFTAEALATLTREEYIITEQADRMGYRLRGARLTRAREGELLSCGVTLGAIQVPPDGQPIVLMADHQTTGGYPIIATLVHQDIGSLAQRAPGERVRFRQYLP